MLMRFAYLLLLGAVCINSERWDAHSTCTGSGPGSSHPTQKQLEGSKPNIIIVYADDLGYGDIEAFGGHPTSDTPSLDAMVRQGMRFNSIYTSSPICSPSRSSVMTGRYMTRNGVWPGVFSPNSVGGLALDELTLPQLLHEKAGYDTFMAGKWHLGVGEGGAYLPFHRGFQHYHGVPYGVDMCSLSNINISCFAPDVGCDVAPFVGGSSNFPGRSKDVPCPYLHNATIFEQPTSLLTIDEKYVNATRHFIMAHARVGTHAPHSAHGGTPPPPPPPPFFVYFASHHTHVPVFANAEFTNTSNRGWFGDHLRMLDWSVGEILQAVHDAGVASNTLTLFSADNGPSLTWENMGGNNGAMRCGKGTTFEGGQRVPGIAYWPGTVGAAATSHDVLSTMDFFATSLALAGVPLPSDRTIDAIDFTPVLQGKPGKREVFVYWGGSPDPTVGLHAVRKGDWKMHWWREGSHCKDVYPDPWCYERLTQFQTPMLYNLAVDVGEIYNMSLAAYPEIVAELTAIKVGYEKQADMFGPSEIAKGGNNAFMPCANPHCTPAVAQFPVCCQTNFPPLSPPPAPPAPPAPSALCEWQHSTSLGLSNSTADKRIASAAAETKEACCGMCRARGSACKSAHFLAGVCNLWSGHHARAGEGMACVPV